MNTLTSNEHTHLIILFSLEVRVFSDWSVMKVRVGVVRVKINENFFQCSHTPNLEMLSHLKTLYVKCKIENKFKMQLYISALHS